MLFGSQGGRVDDATVTMLVGAGGVVLVIMGYLLIDFIRARMALKRLDRKRRDAQKAWEEEQEADKPSPDST